MAQAGVVARLTQTPESTDALVSLNADQVARAYRADDSEASDDEIALRAARRTDANLDQLIEAGRSCLIETVLSSDKYLATVARAKAAGYWVGLIYVLLRDPALNVARVAQRVALGGHGVPEQRIRARWERSLARLPAFAALADAVVVWDNSDPAHPARLLLEVLPGHYFVAPEADALIASSVTPHALRAALQAVIDAL